jgi:hypothetical protein
MTSGGMDALRCTTECLHAQRRRAFCGSRRYRRRGAAIPFSVSIAAVRTLLAAGLEHGCTKCATAHDSVIHDASRVDRRAFPAHGFAL